MARKSATPITEASINQTSPVIKNSRGWHGASFMVPRSIFQEKEVVRGPYAVADGKAVPDRLGDIGLRGSDGVGQRLAFRQLRSDRRGIGATCAVGMRGLDELALVQIEEPAVVEQVGRFLRKQMPALDRSEERRVGKECRSRWWTDHDRKKVKE